jgi:internalin A
MKCSPGGWKVIATLSLVLVGYADTGFAEGNVTSSAVLHEALRINATQLDLRGTEVSDKDLEGISGPSFAGVVTVLLARTDISDEGMQQLQQLQIRELDVFGTQITDAGLSHLQGLPIERLDLTGTAITDAGFTYLSKMPLSRLILRNTTIKGDGLAQLNGSAIETLDLSFTQTVDRNLATLSDWEKLEIINLSETPVTDSGLLQLVKVSKLTNVYISGTGVTQEGITRFQVLRPSVKVISESPVR